MNNRFPSLTAKGGMLLAASKLFFYLSFFSIVVVLTSTFFPFIGGKYYFFRVAVELSLIFVFLFWAFQDKDGETARRLVSIRRNPLFLAVSIFALAFMLAVLFANNPNGAFWSNYERGDGGFQMLHYYAFFVLALFLLQDALDWKWAFRFSVIAALCMISYGVLGYIQAVIPGFLCIDGGGATASSCLRLITPYRAGTGPSGFWSVLTGARFQGSLGNPAYVAPYLSFSLFYLAFLWIHSSFRKKWYGWLLYGGLSIVFLLFFILSQTRGAFLGLVAGVFVAFLYLIFTWEKRRKWALSVLALLFLAGGTLVAYRHSSFVESLPGGRLFAIVDLGYKTDSVQTRLWTWGSAWQGFKERPILGWGPENFSTVFDKYFDIRHYNPQTNSETWFDRAHSIVFDYLAETGVIGFLSYLGMFGVFGWLFVRSERRFKDMPEEFRGGRGILLRALLLGVLVSYLVQGLALFDVLPIYINLFLVLAFSLYYFRVSATKSLLLAHNDN